MLARASDSAETSAMPDGGNAQVVFHAGDFGVHWPSETDVTVAVLPSSRTIDLTMTATTQAANLNRSALGGSRDLPFWAATGSKCSCTFPARCGWKCAVREASPRESCFQWQARPTTSACAAAQSWERPIWTRVSWTLHKALLDNGPSAELSDPEDNFGVRLMAMSPAIKAMRVLAPADGNFVSIAPQFNYPDPFGREWKADTDTGMVVLQPGESTQWKVRLELFSLEGEGPQPSKSCARRPGAACGV